jgi:hypothetical protein
MLEKTPNGRCSATWKITRTKWYPREQNGKNTEIEVISKEGLILEENGIPKEEILLSWKVTKMRYNRMVSWKVEEQNGIVRKQP